MASEQRKTGIFKILKPAIEKGGKFDATALRQEVTTIVDGGELNISIDLSDIEYVSSMEINVLVILNKKILEASGRFSILSPNRKIMDILDKVGITGILRVYKNETEIQKDSNKIVNMISSMVGGASTIKAEQPEQQIQSPKTASSSGSKSEFDLLKESMFGGGAKTAEPDPSVNLPDPGEKMARLKEEQETAERQAKEEAERKEREKTERKAKEIAERKAKEKTEQEAKEKAELQAKEEAERKEREKTEREAKEIAERKAKEKAEQEAKEKAAKVKAEREAETQEIIATRRISRKRPETEKKSPVTLVLSIVILLLLIGGGAFFYLKKDNLLEKKHAVQRVVQKEESHRPLQEPEKTEPAKEEIREKEPEPNKKTSLKQPVRKKRKKKTYKRETYTKKKQPVSDKQAKPVQRKQPQKPSGETGTIFFSTNPPRADIYYNGSKIGRANETKVELPVGSVTLIFRKGGKSAKQSFAIKKGSNNSPYVALTQGGEFVQTKQPEPEKEAPKATSKPAPTPKTTTTTPQKQPAAQPAPAAQKPAAPPPPKPEKEEYGTLFIVSIPKQADIYHNGKKIGVTNVTNLKLPIGKTTLTIKKGRKSINKNVDIKPGENPVLSVKL